MADRFEQFVSKAKQHKDLWKAVMMAFLPLLCCVMACALEGRTLGEVSLAAGEWNDELFYYKLVEGTVRFGMPQGYFGFNESHALIASFAAWSPVLVLPWILWGKILGWSLSSPIYCNIFLMMAAMFLFVRLVKPGWKQLGILSLLYVFFTPVTRYMLSGMPECICFSLVIIVLALEISYLEKEHPAKLVLLFVLTSLMTLMRPYLLLFMFLPGWFWMRKKRLAGALGTLAVMGGTGAVYVLISHFFSAEYFTPLFDTTWAATFFTEGILAGIKYVIWRLLYVGWNFCLIMWEGLRGNLFYGEYFAAFFILLLILLIQTVRNFRRKEKKQLVINLNLLLIFAGMLAALLLMYKMQEGSKHLLTFVMAGIYAVSLMETRFYKKAVAVGTMFAFLFVGTPVDSYEHQIPFTSPELETREEYWQEILAENCELDTTLIPSFDNVIIWVFNDKVGEEELLTPYQMLYQLPEGFGVSCCYSEFILDHFDELQSKYLAVVAGGEIDRLCLKKGARELGRDQSLVVYELPQAEKRSGE